MLVYEWLSQCCEAAPIGEVDESINYYPIGFCSKCLEGCGFYEGELDDDNE